jgi:Tfp pilus assembly protein PilO
MKSFSERIMKNFHYVVLINTGVAIFQNYEEMNVQIKQVQETVESLEEKIDLQINKNKRIREFEKDLEASKLRIKEVSSQIELVQRQLPNTILDTEILDYFSKQANDLNLKDVYLSPLKEENKDFYYSKQYEFKAVGTFLQFMIFFEKVSYNDRLLNIKSLVLSSKIGVHKGRFQLLQMNSVMEAFRYNPDYSKDIGVKDDG